MIDHIFLFHYLCRSQGSRTVQVHYSITTEERDENSSEEEESSITTENSSEEEIDPWTTLINDAASKVQAQYDDRAHTFAMTSFPSWPFAY